MTVEFTLNDEFCEFSGDPRTPLLDVLRNTYRMTGTKSVCRAGFCGACIVTINGQPVPSCQRPIGLLQDAYITTIEGISPAGSLNAVQHAFLEHDVVQCGMCFPGMVVTLTHFLANNSAPTRADIKEALAGNMCRCTGYERIIDAVLTVSSQKTLAPEAAAP